MSHSTEPTTLKEIVNAWIKGMNNMKKNHLTYSNYLIKTALAMVCQE